MARTSPLIPCVAVVVSSALASCGPGSSRSPSPAAEVEVVESALEPEQPVERVERARGITLQIPWEHVQASGGIETFVGRPRPGRTWAGPGEPPLPIFLNRNGGTYSPGNDDSRYNTSIVPNQQSTVSAYAGSNAEWQQIVTCLTDMFAAFNVVMVETEPSGGEYIESVIGGTPQQVGLPNGVGGVAPIDSFQCNIIPNAIVFTFSAVVGNDPQASCEIAAQEIAHAISLDHEYYCPDPMTYLGGCGDKVFRDYDAQCGEYQPRGCNCGRQLQNSVQVLIEKLGTNTGLPPPPPPNDPNPPTVSILSPADGATLPQDSTIQVQAEAIDDMQLAATELVWEFTNSVFPCPYNGNGGSVVCTRSGNISTWNLRVGQGDRRFSVRARDTANNQTVTPVRLIHLGNTPPPPMDSVPPVVAVVSPDDGASLTANSTIRVSATASDDVGLASVELIWSAGQTSRFPCPFNGQGVSCVEQSGTYTWELTVGVGTRRFSVEAADLAGNRTATVERGIVLTTETPPNPGADTVAEPNNTPGEAFPARCGNAIDLVVATGNDDWFSFDAPAGTTVEVAVAAMMGSVIGVDLYTADGQTMLATTEDVLAAGGSIRAVSQGPVILSKIRTGSPALTYRLTALCTNDQPPIMPPADDSLEENDEPAAATRVACADVRTNLTAADPDYFVLDVPEGQTLKVSVSGGGATATILDGDGQVIAPAAMEPAVGGRSGDLWIKIEPTGATTTYDARFECTESETAPPIAVNDGRLKGGCSCSTGEESADRGLPRWLFIAALALVLRRRR
jgi:MYXO-CTERM domain-containing protein